MSDDQILGRHAARVVSALKTRNTEADGDAPEDFGCFGWLRGIRDRAVMLELRKRNGNILAIGYGWLERAEFDPSDGIALHVVGGIVRIRGRNLNAEVRPGVRLFQGVIAHRVTWIRESADDVDHSTVVIENIEA